MVIHCELLSEDDSLEDDKDVYQYALLKKMKVSRYLYCAATYRKRRKNQFTRLFVIQKY
jgi:hypothetical protein